MMLVNYRLHNGPEQYQTVMVVKELRAEELLSFRFRENYVPPNELSNKASLFVLFACHFKQTRFQNKNINNKKQ